jgi:hypothetical protein
VSVNDHREVIGDSDQVGKDLMELWECGGLPPLFFRSSLAQPQATPMDER